MIFDQKGQTYRFGDKIFTVGGTVMELCKEYPGPLGTILEIHAENDAAPTAQCGYEDYDPENRLLEKLEPISPAVPPETERQYALYFYFDGSDGQRADVLGVSNDRSVLVRKMLDDAKNDESISAVLVSAWENPEEKTLRFFYESTDDADDFYLEYVIKPVPIYGKNTESDE